MVDFQEAERSVLRTDTAGVAVLTINRPEFRNAMSKHVIYRINVCLDEIEVDDSVSVILFTGSGNDSFVAGADINELAVRTPVDGLAAVMQRLYDRIANFGKPTVAAVNGYAFGGGLELALACDIRIGSSNSEFALPETGLGIIPAAGGTQRLAKIVGLGRAVDMILTGRRLDAEQAYAAGLITEVVNPSDLLGTAQKTAQRISRKGPLAIRLVKKVVQRGFDVDHETGVLLESLAQAVIYSSEEKSEGTSAFLEKRRPDFDRVRHDRKQADI